MTVMPKSGRTLDIDPPDQMETFITTRAHERRSEVKFLRALRVSVVQKCRELLPIEEGRVSDTATMLVLGEDYPELRDSVRKICERYPGEYWRKLEAEQAYPTEFITELTQGGFLASLIPEEYGGSGLPLRAAAVILEEINASG